jgi:branched-chain amino acid aminotransferase
VFRLGEHIDRLFDSVRIYHTKIPYTKKQIHDAILQTIRASKLKACYIRPIVYRGYGDVGVNPLGCPVDVAIAVWEWGSYLGKGALDKGIEVCISSWHRPAPNTIPTMAKSGGNYLGSQLIKMEAVLAGFSEGIALCANGTVSEGSGENLFLVKNNVVHTPPISASILPGITRASIITLLKEMRYEVREAEIPREMLSIADEVFFTGTAAEISPICSIDRHPVGEGKPGPITRKLQKKFFEILLDAKSHREWLTFV